MSIENFDYSTLAQTKTTMEAAFGIKTRKNSYLRAYESPGPHTPIKNRNYIFQQMVLQFILFWWIRTDHKPLWLWGHNGTGKTSAILQFFARLNVPVFRQEVNAYSRFEDWVGYMGINEDGRTEFQYGSLALAMKYGGIFMLEEADKLPNAVASALHGVLDGQPLFISENGGEPIYPHENFRIVVTANTNGAGNNSLYPESKIQDVAYMARFLVHKVNYMSPDLEKRVLKATLNNSIPDDILDKMVRYAKEVREVFVSETMDKRDKVRITMEVRSIIDWAQMTMDCEGVARQKISPVEYALEAVMLGKASPGDREKLLNLYQAVFGRTLGEEYSDEKEED